MCFADKSNDVLSGESKNYGIAEDEGVQDAVAAIEAELGDTGRVLLRKSGTEALVRVMVEAADAESARAYADMLAAVVKERLVL